jgi:hypothetical protein
MHRLTVPIESVRVHIKKLRKLHPRKVAQYEADFEYGDEFPPIEVENCGAFYTIRDGRHRYIAQKNLEYAMIDVVVVRGNAGVLSGRSASSTPAPPWIYTTFSTR